MVAKISGRKDWALENGGEKYAVVGFLMCVGGFISFWRKISKNACLENFHFLSLL